MRKPIMLSIRESKECKGMISQYLVRDEFYQLYQKINETSKDILDRIDSTLDGIIVTGLRPVKSIGPVLTKPTHAFPSNNNSYGDPIIGGPSSTGDYQKTVTIGGTPLPPYRIHMSESGEYVTDSEIYHPCLRDPGYTEALGSRRDQYRAGVFQTGGYPENVKQYECPSENRPNGSATSMCASNHNEISESIKRNKTLEAEIMSPLFESIAKAQVLNLISSLEQSSVKLSLETLRSLKALMYAIITLPFEDYHVALSSITRIGVATTSKKSMFKNKAHSNTSQAVFVEMSGSDDARTLVGQHIQSVLIKNALNDKHFVMVVSPEQYKEVQRCFPINICFHTSIMEESYADVLTMTAVNENRFTEDVAIILVSTPYVEFFGPSSGILVPMGSSGTLNFNITTPEDSLYIVDSVRVNNKVYKLSDLMSNNKLPVNDYAYSSLSATITETGKTSSILSLSYTNLTASINVSINLIKIIDSEEFYIDLSNTRAYNSKDNLLGYISFSQDVERINDANLIKVYEVIRSFDDEGERVTVEYEDSNIELQFRSGKDASLSTAIENCISFFGTQPGIKENKELMIEFQPGALLIHHSVPGEVPFDGVNSQLYLRFAINIENGENCQILENENDIPDYLLHKPDNTNDESGSTEQETENDSSNDASSDTTQGESESTDDSGASENS